MTIYKNGISTIFDVNTCIEYRNKGYKTFTQRVNKNDLIIDMFEDNSGELSLDTLILLLLRNNNTL